MNPLLSAFATRYGAVPFDQITIDDYLPAFEAGISEENAEIAAIVSNPEPPTFANTIEAYEDCGATLERVSGVFFNMLETDGTDAMHALAEDIQPRLTEHANDIALNRQLFERIRAVWQYYNNVENPSAKQLLTEEQQRLLQNTYDDFVEGGALLEGDNRETWRSITQELDTLTLQYEENVLHATHAWHLVLTSDDEVAGLPDTVRQSMAEAWERRQLEKPETNVEGETGHSDAVKKGWLLTLEAPSYRPFMTYSSRRDLREVAYRAYATRCVGGRYDNTAIVLRIAELRRRMAAMLGHKSFADYNLSTGTMAKTVDRVNGLLRQLLEAYIKPAHSDVTQVEVFARQIEGDTTFQLQPWDFAYYSEKLKNKLYAFDDELLRPYFPLDRVKAGVFGLATRLYGLTFEQTDEVAKYHPEVETYVVRDADGSHLGLLYTDFFPRPTKQGGAWMTEFRGQQRDVSHSEHDCTDTRGDEGQPSLEAIRPHISIVMNFSRPTNGKPSLLTYDELQTLLHEFGHAMHGLLTRVEYESMSGTNVAHDFVELPSQFNENFASHKEFLDTFAAHYETGDKIPDTYIKRIRDARHYLAAYDCVRQLSFGMLDMAWHTLHDELALDGKKPLDIVTSFERQATNATQLLPRLHGALTSTAFTHIFSGGYAAGYYGYKWSEVLDADAFAVFEREGLFNPSTAQRFRRLLEAGDSRDAAQLYHDFRGGEPTIEALMRRDGIIE